MKIEIGEKRPEHFKELWPGQYEISSHLEYLSNLPQTLFAVATVKANGKPNINMCAWSTFTGDGGGFFAVLGSIYKHTHTYENILRDGEFSVNFLSRSYYNALRKTIEHNGFEDDEFELGGFTQEKSKIISVPRIAESFLSFECSYEKTVELSGGPLPLIIGKVRHLAVRKDYALSLDTKYGDDGFILYISGPKDPDTGEGDTSMLAACRIVQIDK